MEQVTKAIDQLDVKDVKHTLKENAVVEEKEVKVEEEEEVEDEDKVKEDGDEVKEVKEDEDVKEDKEDTKPKKPELHIEFKVPHDDDYISPYIQLGSRFHKSYDRCLELDEIVLPAEAITNNTDENKYVTLWLDYPLDDEYSFQIYPEDASKGFTRGHLLITIKRTYDKLYAEEEETSSLPVENIPGMLNRATTDGNYGVWGHVLDDLVLHTISYDYEKNEIWLGIDS